ncbi:MAG: hypothetical protein Q8M15_02070 [Bacteroidota bacterium]|nr:hypothetical protein [Bacteroidota bacterium]
MQNQKNNILGLSVGTQLMGMALVKGSFLEDWQVKNFEGSWTNMKLRIIIQTIERYIKDHSVSFVALKVPELSRSSPAIEKLTDALLSLCEKINIQVNTYTIADLKNFCDVKNKEELMQYVLALYPELSKVFAKTQKVKKVYYVKIFEAVLATMVT